MKKILVLIASISIISSATSLTLTKETLLEAAHQFAHSYPENPTVDTKTVLVPDYTQWHLAHLPSWWQKVLDAVSLKPLYWKPHTFSQLLESVLEQRKAEGYAYPHALLLKPKPNSHIIIIGPLYGAAHSLVRILDELVLRKHINEDLKIIAPDSYIVFTGNLVNGSPYNLETLQIVLQLMKTNPERVFYLTGTQEERPESSIVLNNELTVRATPDLMKQINSFFSTLPKELVLVDPQNKPDLIKIGSLSQTYDESTCKKQLAQASFAEPITCPLIKATDNQLPINAFIISEKRLMSYKEHPGLVLLPSDGEELTYSVFSAPTQVYRDYFQFYYDAFAILSIGQSFEESALTLYNEDAREQTKFKKSDTYAVLLGKKLDPFNDNNRSNQKNSVSKNSAIKKTHEAQQQASSAQLKQSLNLTENIIPLLKPNDAAQQKIKKCIKKTSRARAESLATRSKLPPIYLGCTLDLTKGASALSIPTKEGITLAISRYNQLGGINGRELKVIFMDDQYTPDKAKRNIETFMKTYKSRLFLCNIGSPTLQAYLDLVKEGKIFVFFPATGAPLFRQPDLNYIVHWRVSYPNEGKYSTHFLINELGLRKFAFLYQNDAFGLGPLQGAREALKRAGIEKATEVPYERNTTSFKSQVETIKNANVEAIGLFAAPAASTEFLRQAGVELVIGKTLFAVSDMAEENFQKFAQQRGFDLIVAQFCPNPETSNLEIVKEYREALHNAGYGTKNIFGLEGFISATIAVDILKKAALKTSIKNNTYIYDIDPTAIVNTIKTIKNYQFKGLTLTFNPKTHELAHMLWLDTGKAHWIEQKIS